MIAFNHEKTFRDRGSGFVVMKAFIDWHKKYIEWWRKKLKNIYEKAFRDLGSRIMWDNWQYTGNERDKTRFVLV